MAQQVTPLRNVAIGSDLQRGLPVDNTYDAATMWATSDDNADRIGCGAADRAGPGHRLHRVEGWMETSRKKITYYAWPRWPGRSAGRELTKCHRCRYVEPTGARKPQGEPGS